jgi:hypothetical protein
MALSSAGPRNGDRRDSYLDPWMANWELGSVLLRAEGEEGESK